ncbi:hypothetical protein LG047_04015 [Methylocystis sp. WRRC1]|uniref:hypothetical protein n=1 Tax=Methylocystis sp. WRRC1 TaxID=1732014 RepID=UPI001D157335|nr:hypothetical protein [Methylocystis sp. WRRC1]MCC3244494.1 hypothetical protein [Methylocystis sp. WRRC1]
MNQLKRILPRGLWRCPDDRFNLAGEILHRTEQGSQPGSIALMSLYRNVLFHYLGPRYGIARPMYTFNIESTEFGDIPFLISPLYDDFEALKLVERGQVSLGWLDREGEFERFLRCKSHIDALEFCFDSYSELLKVGRAIERVIDIKSEIRKITEKEILSGEFRDELGNLTRYRRNDSGQLEQF